MNIFIIDDHGLFRAGLTQILAALDSSNQLTALAGVTDLDQIENDDPADLVLLDLHIPGEQSESNIVKVRTLFPLAKIVVVSAETDPSKILKAIEQGASGYIPKSANPDVLAAALALVLAGGVYLPPEIGSYFQALAADSKEPDNPLDELSARQKEVLRLAINGQSNNDIAASLSISLDTVKAHLSNAYRCLGVHSRTQAVLKCHELGGLM
ncbi:MAG: response regulator transcription factor [Pseudomonadota bacterium]